jgi:hypothetical protein
MENSDPKTSKATDRASDELTVVVRLLARQAARVLVEQQTRSRAASRKFPDPTEKPP